MRWLAAVVVVVVVVCLAGTSCTGGEPSGVRGDLVYLGGPAAFSLVSAIPGPGTVHVYGLDGTVKGSATFSEGKSFSIELALGTYRVTAESGDASCHPVTVTVGAHAFAHVQARCDVK